MNHPTIFIQSCTLFNIVQENIYEKRVNDRRPGVREKGKNKATKRLFLSFRGSG